MVTDWTDPGILWQVNLCLSVLLSKASQIQSSGCGYIPQGLVRVHKNIANTRSMKALATVPVNISVALQLLIITKSSKKYLSSFCPYWLGEAAAKSEITV